MDYRVYTLDSEGHVVSARELDCANDEEAKLKASQLLDGHDLEVWQRARRVALLKRHATQ